jgi:hypothetical protein
MHSNMLWSIVSVPATNFREALAPAAQTLTAPFVASAINNLNGVPPIDSRRFLIRAIAYSANENIGLEFDFFTSALGGFISRFAFTSANGAQYGGAGQYNYYIDGLSLPYYDADTINSINPPQLHVGVQNVDTVAKSAGDAGAVTATFWLESMTQVQG